MSEDPTRKQYGLDELVNASMFALGWIMGNSGMGASPVVPLAHALKNMGVVSTYLDAILKEAEKEEP